MYTDIIILLKHVFVHCLFCRLFYNILESHICKTESKWATMPVLRVPSVLYLDYLKIVSLLLQDDFLDTYFPFLF